VPFIRPQNISKDNTEMIDVVKHLIKFTEKEKYNFDALIILQPTSPLRKISDLNKACKIFSKKNWDSLISTIPIPHQFSNNLVLNNKGHFFKLKKKFISLRNNINEKYTSDGGYLFITKKDKLKKYIIGGKIYGYKIDPKRSIDINYKYEFDIAEILMKKMFN
jgi:CMP-N-acetylneuraminic acid synthetase